MLPEHAADYQRSFRLEEHPDAQNRISARYTLELIGVPITTAITAAGLALASSCSDGGHHHRRVYVQKPCVYPLKYKRGTFFLFTASPTFRPARNYTPHPP